MNDTQPPELNAEPMTLTWHQQAALIEKLQSELASLRSRYAGVEAAWLAYKNRGVAPAPNEYQALAKALDAALAASKGPSDPEAVT